MCGSYPQGPLLIEKQSPSCCYLLRKLCLCCLSGSSCLLHCLLLASPRMTSVRKLVSTGAVDSNLAIWQITVVLDTGPQAFLSSWYRQRHFREFMEKWTYKKCLSWWENILKSMHSVFVTCISHELFDGSLHAWISKFPAPKHSLFLVLFFPMNCWRSPTVCEGVHAKMLHGLHWEKINGV